VTGLAPPASGRRESRPPRRRAVGGLAIAIAGAIASMVITPAAAEPVTVGVYVPSMPFEGTAARLELANKLAAHLAGADGVGRVYGKASDFAAALARGDIQLAVADASFLATTGVAHTDLAVAVRDGDTAVGWQLVARPPVAGVLDLRGKTIVAPVASPADFVANAMLGGELPAGFFRVEPSPDVVSAVAAVELGKADAAVVPDGVALPGGVARIATLPTVSWPVLIAARGAPADVVARARERAGSFPGSGAIAGFRAGGADGYLALARRLRRAVRQPPMLLPDLRITVGELLAGRAFAIARPPLASYLSTTPAPTSPPPPR
jgi:ABC-type amino acid transport substrate-binding protein